MEKVFQEEAFGVAVVPEVRIACDGRLILVKPILVGLCELEGADE